MKNKPKLSIIILSYNTKSLLKDCLLSVKRARINGFKLQTIVVDNASTDDSASMVKEKFPWVDLVESEKNLGYSRGNNLGLKKAKGKYICFLNSDVEIKPKALLEMKNLLDSDSGIGAVTPKVNLFSGGMDPDCHRGFPTPWASISYFLGLESIFPKSKIFGRYHMGCLDLNKIHEIDAGFGTFMFVRKKVLDQIGSWDEKYFFYGEDLDLFYRIKEGGWKIMFYPRVLALHHKGASSGLRKESRSVSKADRSTKIKTAKASITAMQIFYKKFYKGKYNILITFLVLSGIKMKGLFRILKFYLTA